MRAVRRAVQAAEESGDGTSGYAAARAGRGRRRLLAIAVGLATVLAAYGLGPVQPSSAGPIIIDPATDGTIATCAPVGRYAIAGGSPLCVAVQRWQNDAVDAVIRNRGLSNGDGMVDSAGNAVTGTAKLALARGLALRNARGDVRAQMWLDLLDMIQRPVADRSADQQLIVDFWTGIMKQHRIDVAEEALAQFDEFDADVCAYRSPTPYESDWGPGAGRYPSWCSFPTAITTVVYPEAEQFTKWGSAVVNEDILSPNNLALSAEAVAAIIAAAAGVGAAGLVGLGSGVLLSAVGSKAVIAVVTPFALQLKAGVTIGSSAGLAAKAVLGIVLVVLLAVIVGVFFGIAIFSDDGRREQLNELLSNATNATVDLRSETATAATQQSLFTLFIDWTSGGADPGRTADVPSLTGDAQYVTTANSVVTKGDTFTVADWAGTNRTYETNSGYFIIAGIGATWFPYLDAVGKERMAYRWMRSDGSAVFSTIPADGSEREVDCTSGSTTGTCAVTDTITARRADGTVVTVAVLVNRPPTATFDAVVPVVEGSTVQFTARPSDPDGDEVAVRWFVEDQCLSKPGPLVIIGCFSLDGADVGPNGRRWVEVGTGTTMSSTFRQNGSWPVRARLTDPFGGLTDYVFTQTVTNAPPVLELNPASGTSACTSGATCDDRSPTVGSPVTIGGRFTDRGIYDRFRVTVDWGDGEVDAGALPAPFCFDDCPARVITVWEVADGTWAFSAMRTFEDQTPERTAIVTVTDDAMQSDSAPAVYEVKNAIPTLSGLPTAVSITEGGTAVLTGSVVDPSPGDSFTIEVPWPTGTKTYAVPALDRTFRIEEQIADDDPTGTPSDLLLMTVTVTDQTGLSSTTEVALTVENAPPVLQDLVLIDQTGLVIGRDVPGVLPGVPVRAATSFSDVGVADTWTAVFDWGTLPPTQQTPAQGPISAVNVYSAPGSTTVTVTVTDDDTGTAVVSAPLSVLSYGAYTAPITSGLATVVDAGTLSPPGRGQVRRMEAAIDTAIAQLNAERWGPAARSIQMAADALSGLRPADAAQLEPTLLRTLTTMARAASAEAIAEATTTARTARQRERLAEAVREQTAADVAVAAGRYLDGLQGYVRAATVAPTS